MQKLVYEKIYEKLESLGILGIKEYQKLKSGAFMDLNVDVIRVEKDYKIIAMAHNFIQNGDVMADPDMEIKIYPDLKMAEALTYQLDSLGIYQVVYPKPGYVNLKIKKDLNIFLNQWLNNIKDQEFKAV